MKFTGECAWCMACKMLTQNINCEWVDTEIQGKLNEYER